jgi:hypothetical protein
LQSSAYLQKEQSASLALHTCHSANMDQSQQLYHVRRRKGRRLMEGWILGVGEVPRCLENRCVSETKFLGSSVNNRQGSSTSTSTSKACFVPLLGDILQMTKSRVFPHLFYSQIHIKKKFRPPATTLRANCFITFIGHILRVSRHQYSAILTIQSSRLSVTSHLSCILPLHQRHISMMIPS